MMSKHRLAAAAVLVASFVAPAVADSTQRVEITAQRLGPTAQVMQELDAETRFEMSSGRSMTVTVVAIDKLQVRYGRHFRRTLTADGHGAFVSSDGIVRLGFEMGADGVIQRVALRLPADSI